MGRVKGMLIDLAEDATYIEPDEWAAAFEHVVDNDYIDSLAEEYESYNNQGSEFD
jgi:hypothetical protein